MLIFNARTLLVASALCVVPDLPAQSCGVPLARVRHSLSETEWQGLGCPTCPVQYEYRESGPASEATDLSLEGRTLTQRYASRIVGSAQARAWVEEGEVQIEHELQQSHTFQAGVDIHDFGLATDVDLYVPGASGTEYAVALEFQSDPTLPRYYGRGLSYEVSTASGIRVSALATGWSGIARGRTSGTVFYRGGTAYSYATSIRVAGGASAGYSCILACTFTPWNTVGQSLKLNARVLRVEPDLEVTPREMDFGDVIWRQSRQFPLVLRNTGLSTLAGTIAQPIPNPQFRMVGETDFRLGPDEEHRLIIQFTAAAPILPAGSPLREETSTKFQIHSNDPCEPLIVLTATAVRERALPRYKRCDMLPYQGDLRHRVRVVFESTSGNIEDVLSTAVPGASYFRERLGVASSSANPYYAPSPPFNAVLPNPAGGVVGSHWGPRVDRALNEGYIDDGHGPHGAAPFVVYPLRQDAYELWQQYEYNLGLLKSSVEWIAVGPQFRIGRAVERRGSDWYYTIRKSHCPGEMAVRIP